jgi:NADH:ubiquinone reductase (H+-translocating)
MSPDAAGLRLQVVIVGGGFAGVGCAKRLAGHEGVDVMLLDRNNYHQFQPLLYQVATSQIASSSIAFSLRKLFRRHPNIRVKMAEVAELDPATRTVTTTDGRRFTGDVVVLAAGSRPNFFHTAGADRHAFPLYSLSDAGRLRSRILGVFEAADNDPRRVEQGALTFVIVGGGPTGVEMAGALADLVRQTMTAEYHDLDVAAAEIHLVDLGDALLGPFSDKAHHYVSEVLARKGVHVHLGVAVKEVGPGHVTLSDGSTIRTRCVVWGGGIMAPLVAAADDLPHGHGGRIEVRPDLTVDGASGVYAVGDVANIPGRGGRALPQLGSVAMQSGAWAAKNILATSAGRPRRPFRYVDKGMMAMIGRGAAIAVGPWRRELHGLPAFGAWLGVHAVLMTGIRNRIEAFIDWGWDYVSHNRGPQVLDRSEAAEIDWADDATPAAAPAEGERPPEHAPA